MRRQQLDRTLQFIRQRKPTRPGTSQQQPVIGQTAHRLAHPRTIGVQPRRNLAITGRRPPVAQVIADKAQHEQAQAGHSWAEPQFRRDSFVQITPALHERNIASTAENARLIAWSHRSEWIFQSPHALEKPSSDLTRWVPSPHSSF